MPATQTYKLIALLKGLSPARLLGTLVLALGLSWSLPAKAENEYGFGFSRLSPPQSKFQLPNFGDVSHWRSDMEKAKKAYIRGDFVTARKNLESALKKGNFIAAWYLGHIYRKGLGVKKHPGKSFHYYRTVALEYDSKAPRNRIFLITLDSLVWVADGYRTGVKSGGVKRDYARAMRLYAQAASAGHPGAQFGAGRMLIAGQGVRKNVNSGLRWVFLAAKKNHPPALAYLGNLYWNGKHLRKSIGNALMMYIVATRNSAEHMNPDIFDRLDMMAAKVPGDIYRRAENLADSWMMANTARPGKISFRKNKNKPKRNPIRAFFRSLGN